MENFLEEGASAPKTNSNYFKLIEGTIKFRIVSPAKYGYEYWTEENKPVRLHEKSEKKPEDVRVEANGSWIQKHFWAFKVIDREDGVVKVFEITQKSVKEELEALNENPEWGNPSEYDISITGTGKGLDRRYTVQPSPRKPLTKEEESLVARTEIDLDALFTGDNPFNEKSEISDSELEKIPF